MSQDAGCGKRFLYALLATVVKLISDLRLLIPGLCALLFALSVPASAQQPGKVPRIGFLTNFSASDPQEALRLEGFRQGLRVLDYIEDKNINIEYRYARGDLNGCHSWPRI